MDTPVKICKDCLKSFPATTEYFQSEPRTKCGLKPRCRACYLKHHAMKMQQWRDSNPEKARQYMRDYRRKNPERIHALDRNRYQRDREKRIQWQHAYRRAFPEKTAAARKSKSTPHGYRAILASCARREAKKRKLPYGFTGKDWEHALNYFNHCCAVCNRPRGFWHVIAADHWIALTDPRPDNPGTVPGNMIPLCHGINGCNNVKQNRDPVEWLYERYSKKQAQQIIERIEKYFHSIKSNSA